MRIFLPFCMALCMRSDPDQIHTSHCGTFRDGSKDLSTVSLIYTRWNPVFQLPSPSKLVACVPLLGVELCEPFADDGIDLSRALKLSPVSRRERL